jgi:flagellar biosynthesis/type III secretory pathway M-ring protein FliF/YscJ
VSDLKMMPFLYFPEDKTEYIPALITLLLFILLAFVVYRIIKKYSRNEEEKMKDFEEKVLERLEHEHDDDVTQK